MTIESSVRNKVIEMHLNKKKRHEIAYELRLSGIKISTGSISNIIKEKSDSHLATTSEETPAEVEVKKNSSISTENHPIIETPETPQTQPDTKLERAQSDTIELQIEEKIRQKEQIEKDVVALEAQKKTLLAEIEEGHRMLDVEKKATQDFAVVKSEMAEAGIEPSRFLNVINTFKKYNYDCGKIMLTFADIQDIVAEKNNVRRLKQEVDNNQRAFDNMLSSLGINLDDLKRLFISLMSLEQQGVSLDQIVGLSRTNHFDQIRHWEHRGRGWDQDNGGEGQDQGYNYGYPGY
jgi:hypothetical protein